MARGEKRIRRAGAGRHRLRAGRGRPWKYGILPFFVLLSLGILALDRGEGVVNKLAYFLDPMYAWLVTTEEGRAYAVGLGLQTDWSETAGEGDADPVDDGTCPGGISTYINGDVQIVYGDGYLEEETLAESVNGLEHNRNLLKKLKKDQDYSYLIRNFYIVNSTTYVNEDIFPVKKLLDSEMSIEKDEDNPQILIHHTHASEAFADSRAGVEEDTIMGTGRYLAELLSERGYQVIHDTSIYDVVEGKLDRNQAYEMARAGTEAILEKYPSIQVIIDLHRDSGEKRVTVVDGRDTAQIMFFNGLSRNMNGPITYLYNPYLQENLAFSLQLKMKAMEHWADYTKPIFLKGYEYNLSMMPRSILVEVGTEKNTVEEAGNAMVPLAQILDEVLEPSESEE